MEFRLDHTHEGDALVVCQWYCVCTRGAMHAVWLSESTSLVSSATSMERSNTMPVKSSDSLLTTEGLELLPRPFSGALVGMLHLMFHPTCLVSPTFQRPSYPLSLWLLRFCPLLSSVGSCCGSSVKRRLACGMIGTCALIAVGVA